MRHLPLFQTDCSGLQPCDAHGRLPLREKAPRRVRLARRYEMFGFLKKVPCLRRTVEGTAACRGFPTLGSCQHSSAKLQALPVSGFFFQNKTIQRKTNDHEDQL